MGLGVWFPHFEISYTYRDLSPLEAEPGFESKKNCALDSPLPFEGQENNISWCRIHFQFLI